MSRSSIISIADGLKRFYIQKLGPLKVTKQLNDFVAPLLKTSDFDAKPMVMLWGQYSTRKTTFIKHLLKTSYPGKVKTQQRFINNLGDEFGKIQSEFHLPLEDFPAVERFKELLIGRRFDKFKKRKPNMIQAVDDML